MNAKEWLKGYEHRDTTTNGEDLAATIIRAQQDRIERLEAAVEPGGVVQPIGETEMIHLGDNWVRYQNDRLVVRYRNRFQSGDVRSQGKRVSKDCPLTAEERRLYVERGAPSTVRAVRDRLNCSLTEALDILNKARY